MPILLVLLFRSVPVTAAAAANSAPPLVERLIPSGVLVPRNLPTEPMLLFGPVVAAAVAAAAAAANSAPSLAERLTPSDLLVPRNLPKEPMLLLLFSVAAAGAANN